MSAHPTERIDDGAVDHTSTALAASAEAAEGQVERMLSFQSAGDLIDKSARTVRRLVDTGRIRAVVFLGSLRIRESEMARFIRDECARNEALPSRYPHLPVGL